MHPDGPKTFVFTELELSVRDKENYRRGYENGARATLENLVQVVVATTRYVRHLRTILLRLYPEEGTLPGEIDGKLASDAQAAGLALRQLSIKAQRRKVYVEESKISLPINFRGEVPPEQK